MEMNLRKGDPTAGEIQMKSVFCLKLEANMKKIITSKHPNVAQEYPNKVMERRRSFSDPGPDYENLDEESYDNCGSNSDTLQRPPSGGVKEEQHQLGDVRYINVTEVSGPYMNVSPTDTELHKAASDPEHIYESIDEDEEKDWKSSNATWQGIIGVQTLKKMVGRSGGNWRYKERDSHPYAVPYCTDDEENPYEEYEEGI